MNDINVELRDKIDAELMEAYTKLKAGEKELAIRLAEAAWSKFPTPKYDWDVSLSYYQTLAIIYRDANQYDDAVEVMNELFSSGTLLPYQDGPYFTLGTIYFEMGDLDNARKSFQEADRISNGRCFRGKPAKYQAFLKNKK